MDSGNPEKKSGSLYGSDVLGRKPLGPLLDGEFHFLPRGQGAETFHYDFAMMDEQVFPDFFGSDESETFFLIEPLHFTIHFFPLGTS